MAKKKKKVTQQKVKQTETQQNQKVESKEQNPLVQIAIKLLVMLIITVSVIYYFDTKGYFNADETNNHTLRKWDSFYQFTEKNNVDILLFGNSHLYTGLNPKNLSTALGVNAFILASPGTHIADSYYGLVEALKRTKPKLVILETYGVSTFDPYNMSDAKLSDQFKSFSARRDIPVKVASTPKLFNTDNWVYAWSTTIRNHSYIWNNHKQLSINQQLASRPKPVPQRLYLGRYVRFTTGIEDSILTRYEIDGAPVNGGDYEYNDFTKLYIKKFVELCEKEDIELMFLTLPMYHAHIKDYMKWQCEVAQIFEPYPNKWLDMQEPYDTLAFNPIAFENTFGKNQHMTYQGSLVATYKLVQFIKDSLDVNLPDRSQTRPWLQLFYSDEGFFENHAPVSQDPNNKILPIEKTYGVNVKQILSLTTQRSTKLLVKVDASTYDKMPYGQKLESTIAIQTAEDKIEYFPLELTFDPYHFTNETYLFEAYIRPTPIVGVVEISSFKRLGSQ